MNNISKSNQVSIILSSFFPGKTFNDWTSLLNESFSLQIRRQIHLWQKLTTAVNDPKIKSIIYYRWAICSFNTGDDCNDIIKLLDDSYNQSCLFYRKTDSYHCDLKAQETPAFIFKQFLSLAVEAEHCFISSTDFQSLRLNNKKNRKKINRMIASCFDLCNKNTFLYGLSWEPFDKLLKRCPYRVHVQSFYESARWLVDKREELKKTDLEEYGIVYAIMVLSGALIEGVLLKLSKPKNKKLTLGGLINEYFKKYKKPKKEIGFLLFFILYMRNKIHPSNFNKVIDPRMNLNLATIIYRLSERCVALLAQSHKRKNIYK